jgi:hypothetical protein
MKYTLYDMAATLRVENGKRKMEKWKTMTAYN